MDHSVGNPGRGGGGNCGNADFPRLRVLTQQLVVVIRLWNVGRGPGIVQDVRLTFGGTQALAPTTSERPVHAGGAHDASWDSPALPTGWESGELRGVLTILYAHATGRSGRRSRRSECAIAASSSTRSRVRQRPSATCALRHEAVEAPEPHLPDGQKQYTDSTCR